MDNFKEKYPALCSLLNAWFSDSDEPDSTIIGEFKTCESEEYIVVVLGEAQSCLETASFPGIEIGDEANRNFSSDDEAREWLQKLVTLLKMDDLS